MSFYTILPKESPSSFKYWRGSLCSEIQHLWPHYGWDALDIMFHVICGALWASLWGAPWYHWPTSPITVSKVFRPKFWSEGCMRVYSCLGELRRALFWGGLRWMKASQIMRIYKDTLKGAVTYLPVQRNWRIQGDTAEWGGWASL